MGVESHAHAIIATVWAERAAALRRATGDYPATLIPLAGRLHYQGRYLE